MNALVAPDLVPLPGLAVRPDVLWCSVSAQIEGVGASRAVPHLRDAAGALLRCTHAIAPGGQLEARRLRVGGGSAEKASKIDRGDVQLDGVLQLPLEEGLDFWARAELVARLCDAIAGVALELARRKPPILLGWREPVARVADEESHRNQLLERHAEPLRRLLGESKDAPMRHVSWDLTAELIQTPVSLDQVRLTLAWQPHPSPRG